jgi:hypothetical protein
VDPRLVEEYGRADPRLVKECAGIVYLVNWFASVNHSVFDWLAHTGKPVSIVDWFGGWDIPPSLAAKPHIQLLRSPVTAKPGFDAGRFLIDRGHRRTAYFSPYALAWPSVRLQGIADACAAAGGSYSVKPFMQRQVVNEREFQDLCRRSYRALEPSLVPPPDYLSGREHLRATAWLEYENAAHYGTLVPFFEEALAQDGNNRVGGMQRCRSHDGMEFPYGETDFRSPEDLPDGFWQYYRRYEGGHYIVRFQFRGRRAIDHDISSAARPGQSHPEAGPTANRWVHHRAGIHGAAQYGQRIITVAVHALLP